jgi:MoxR-like ATPase
VTERYTELVFRVRDLGIALSDRRAVKVMKLVAASAILCGRSRAIPSDLWVLRYVWDREEQVGPLTALVDGVLKQIEPDEDAYPLAALPEHVDAEEMARNVDRIEAEMNGNKSPSLSALANLRDRVAELTDRAAWIGDDAHRAHLLERLGKLTESLR